VIQIHSNAGASDKPAQRHIIQCPDRWFRPPRSPIYRWFAFSEKTKLDKATFGEGLFSNGEPEEITPNAIGDAAPATKTSMNAELVL
jgi:hypothetical protein